MVDVICFIPEVPFTLDGPNGVLQHLQHLIRTKGAAVLYVAERAGQELLASLEIKDLSEKCCSWRYQVHTLDNRSYLKTEQFYTLNAISIRKILNC